MSTSARDRRTGARIAVAIAALGIASATASYIAVPPFGEMRPSARDSSARSLVQSCSNTGTLLNRYRKISSCLSSRS